MLKVAIDNARAQEKQVQMEKTELKMELFRERELRETLEKQLAVEQKNRGISLLFSVDTKYVIMHVCLFRSQFFNNEKGAKIKTISLFMQQSFPHMLNFGVVKIPLLLHKKAALSIVLRHISFWYAVASYQLETVCIF